LLHRHAFACSVVLDLVFAEIGADAELAGIGVIEVEARNAGSGVHGAALGELTAGELRGVQKFEQRRLLCVVMLSWMQS